MFLYYNCKLKQCAGLFIYFDYPGYDMLSHGSINTDVGLHSEYLPQISKQPPLAYKVNLDP